MYWNLLIPALIGIGIGKTPYQKLHDVLKQMRAALQPTFDAANVKKSKQAPENIAA